LRHFSPFGKTPVQADFPECDLPPAEFFFLLFYIRHNGELVLENAIFDIKPMSASLSGCVKTPDYLLV